MEELPSRTAFNGVADGVPEIQHAAQPAPVGSCSTTRALMARERAMISGRSAVRSTLFSISASSAASQVTAIFTLSASPAATCRGGSEREGVRIDQHGTGLVERAHDVLHAVHVDGAVLPPTEESTCASSVVGTL